MARRDATDQRTQSWDAGPGEAMNSDRAALLLERPPDPAPAPDMVWIPGGTFKMGSDNHYPEERPVHSVSVAGFWIDRFPVTNQRFRRFVDATGHLTNA